MTIAIQRKRANFVFKAHVLAELDQLIPAGDRSEFVNDVVEEALIQFSREKAFELLESFKKKNPVKMTDRQILKTIHDGRKDLL